MPDSSVNENETEKWLKAFIIADFDDGRWLIELPNETLISGARVFVPVGDQGTVVAKGWWQWFTATMILARRWRQDS